MVILWLRVLDWFGSMYRRRRKAARNFWKYGAGWRDKTRSGRVYSRVEYVDSSWSLDADGSKNRVPAHWRRRPEPGWAWTCQNCKSYSFIAESMLAAILASWDDEADKIRSRGYKPGKRPTAATARCSECCYRPGEPE